jgi:hypothetical protein
MYIKVQALKRSSVMVLRRQFLISFIALKALSDNDESYWLSNSQQWRIQGASQAAAPMFPY